MSLVMKERRRHAPIYVRKRSKLYQRRKELVLSVQNNDYMRIVHSFLTWSECVGI
jgi:hypothetical protein